MKDDEASKASAHATNQRRALRRCLCLVVLGLVGLVVLRWIFVHPFRRELPWSAEVVSEESWIEPGPLSQDSSCSLKARMTESELLGYVQRLGLSRYDPGQTKPEMLPAVHELLPCDEGDLGWWRRPGAFEHVYGCYEGRSGWCFVRFSNGTMWAVTGNI